MIAVLQDHLDRANVERERIRLTLRDWLLLSGSLAEFRLRKLAAEMNPDVQL